MQEYKELSIICTFEPHGGSVGKVGISPNGKFVVSSNEGRFLKLWDIETGKCLHTIEVHKHRAEVCSINFSPDSKTVIITVELVHSPVKDYTTLQQYNIETGCFIFQNQNAFTESISLAVFSPDGEVIATSWSVEDDDWTYRETIRLLDVKTYNLIRTLKRGYEDADDVNSIAFSPDGKTIISGHLYAEGKETDHGFEYEVHSWNVETGELLGSFGELREMHKNSITTLCFAPSGETVVSADWQGVIKLWDLEKRRFIREFAGHTDKILSIAYRSNGTQLITASRDKTLRVWEIETGKCLHMFDVSAVSCISQDGEKIIVVVGEKEDETLKMFSINMPTL